MVRHTTRVNTRSEPGTEVRQRWRVVVRRGDGAREMTHRDVEAAWQEGLGLTAVPVALTAGARPRPRLVFGAPVPVGMTAEHEPLDLLLSERLTIADLRPRLLAALPTGHELVDLHDVWLGSPSVAAQVVGADYRCEVEADERELARAVAAVLGSAALPRPARKGDASKGYDLRPLIVSLAVEPDEGNGPVAGAGSARPAQIGAPSRSILRMRLRLQSEAGTGRPDEVLAAIGERLGRELEVRSIVRERLVLAGEE
jgi:radical SAM-linked protein